MRREGNRVGSFGRKVSPPACRAFHRGRSSPWIPRCILGPQDGHLIWKESSRWHAPRAYTPNPSPPLLTTPPPPYLLARVDAIEADSNISVVHAMDFGSSLCKSRIEPSRPPTSSSSPPHPLPPLPTITKKNLLMPATYMNIRLFSSGIFTRGSIPARRPRKESNVSDLLIIRLPP